MKKHLIGTLVVLTTTVLLSGCALYFGDEHDRGGGNSVSPGGGSSGSAQPGQFECQDNGDCAAGCYCAAGGVCEEAGFCTQDSDCGEGYTCNEDRSSCEPVPACACTTDAEATAQGYGWCDEAHGTCQTGTDPSITCAGEPTCNIVAPTCASGEVPLLGADGCWTGTCSAVAQCAAPPACSHINDETNCTARWANGTGDCRPVWNGFDCHATDGSVCQSGSQGCICTTIVFGSCASSTP